MRRPPRPPVPGPPPKRPGNWSAARACWKTAGCRASWPTAGEERPLQDRDLHRRGRLGRRLGQDGPGFGHPGHPASVGQDAERGKGPGRLDLRQRQLMPVVLALGCGNRGGVRQSANCATTRCSSWPMRTVDGSHICTLMLTFFFRYMRPLIEQGHVYVAPASPCSWWQKGNTVKYAYNDKEMALLLQEMPGGQGQPVQGAWAR